MVERGDQAAAEPAGAAPRARGPFIAQLKRAFERQGFDPQPHVSSATYDAYLNADPNAWVVEAALVELLVCARTVFPSEREWKQLLRDESREAIQTFYRIFIRFMPPRMLFLGLGRMWSLTHTMGRIETQWLDQRRVRVSYLEHPPMAHPAYRDLTVAVLESLLELNHTRARVSTVVGGPERLVLEVELV